ncbi:MAG: class I poly(R)-hydroxyalkanoic acid synthase, partial [Rhodoferax sp.]
MTQNAPEFWTQAAQQFQQSVSEGWSKALQSMQGLGDGAPGLSLGGGAKMPEIQYNQDKVKAVQEQYMEEAMELFSTGMTPPVLKDKRFSAPAWSGNPVAAYTAAVYLLNARTLMALTEAVEADAKTRARIRFAVEQWVAAVAPSNFLAFNADAQQKAIDTKGQSIAKGMLNLLGDMRQGHVSM